MRARGLSASISKVRRERENKGESFRDFSALSETPLLAVQMLEIVQHRLWPGIDLACQWKAMDDGDSEVASLRRIRNRALLLLCFWSGFRFVDVASYTVESFALDFGGKVSASTLKTPCAKIFSCPRLLSAYAQICPSRAIEAWLQASEIRDGSVLRHINRWGGVSAKQMSPDSLRRVLTTILNDAGISPPARIDRRSGVRCDFPLWRDASFGLVCPCARGCVDDK